MPVCRNIRVLFNFEPPATEEEVFAAALQYVRKVSGMNKPSKANEAAFTEAVSEIAAITFRLLDGLTPTVPPRDRGTEAERARERGRQREARLRDRLRAELGADGPDAEPEPG